MEPAERGSAPEMQLKQVVLPEPLGPMRPRISPGLTSNETAWSAWKPPKRLVRLETVSTVETTAPPERHPSGGAVKSL